MEEKKKKLFIKIPTSVVRNTNNFISNDEFILYARLYYYYYINKQQEEFKLDHKKLMHFLKITDTRTFKKRMNNLYKANLIKNEIKKIPTRGLITVIFNPQVFEDDEHFTMLNADIFNFWVYEKIDQYAFRQLFYYKSHINLKQINKEFCYVGYETLAKRLKISKSKIIEANRQLKKNKLIRIVIHQIEYTDEYDDALHADRYTNHYFLGENAY